MLVLRALVRDGVVPLLGPPTSIGAFHHGALYYYLLAPAAAPGRRRRPAPPSSRRSRSRGSLAVVATWWLARAIGGPLAGFVAGLLLAVSATSVASSTFIWNPNLAPLFGAVALAGAWQAWASRRPAWWLVAAGGLAVTMQAHVLGVALVLPLAALYVADLRRRRGERRGLIRWGLAGLGLVALGYFPLLVHEIGHDFSETRAALDFLRSGGEPVALDPVSRLVFVALRIVAWPLAGLVTDAPAPAVLAVLAVVAGTGWRIAATRGPAGGDRTDGGGRRALAGGIAGGRRGRPRALRRQPRPGDAAPGGPLPRLPRPPRRRAGRAGRWPRSGGGTSAAAVLAAGGLAALVAWNLATQPPAVAPDGGWPAARAAGGPARSPTPAGRPLALVGLPAFKPTTAYGYPLTVAGGAPGADGGGGRAGRPVRRPLRRVHRRRLRRRGGGSRGCPAGRRGGARRPVQPRAGPGAVGLPGRRSIDIEIPGGDGRARGCREPGRWMRRSRGRRRKQRSRGRDRPAERANAGSPVSRRSLSPRPGRGGTSGTVDRW